jgi:hypothetical protein
MKGGVTELIQKFRSGLGKVFWIDRNNYKLAKLKQLEVKENFLRP